MKTRIVMNTRVRAVHDAAGHFAILLPAIHWPIRVRVRSSYQIRQRFLGGFPVRMELRRFAEGRIRPIPRFPVIFLQGAIGASRGIGTSFALRLESKVLTGVIA